MSVLETLIAADRIVLAGLSAYDQAMARAWENCAAAMAVGGVSADEIEAAKAGHQERTIAGRGNLHRKLWTRAMAIIATAQDGLPRAAEWES